MDLPAIRLASTIRRLDDSIATFERECRDDLAVVLLTSAMFIANALGAISYFTGRHLPIEFGDLFIGALSAWSAKVNGARFAEGVSWWWKDLKSLRRLRASRVECTSALKAYEAAEAALTEFDRSQS